MSGSDLVATDLRLTDAGAKALIAAAEAKARAFGVGQNITVVDAGGNLLAFLRMDGAKTFSIATSRAKAESAASHRQPTSRLDPDLELKLALASGGGLTNLEGGFPVIVNGICIGGIGVGSGTGAQDVACARAALAAIGAETFE